MAIELHFNTKFHHKSCKKRDFHRFFISNQCKKTGINYPDLEPGNEFWNRVRVPGSCYKSLIAHIVGEKKSGRI